MHIDNKKRFIISHILFLFSLIAVYYIPLMSFMAGDKYLPPMNRYVRFYIIGIFSIVFFFYYLYLYNYNQLGLSLFRLNSISLYFWSSTLIIFLLLCASYALLSHDLFEYSLRGRMFTIYGLNPYLHIPLEVKEDVFFPLIFWRDATECYGPAWIIIGALHTIFFKDSLFLTTFIHKITLLIFLLLSCYFFYKLCVVLKLKNPSLITIAFITNPLVIIMTIVDGHNEIVMIFFILASLYFLLNARYILSLILLAVSIQIKFVYVLIIPLYYLYILLNAEVKSLRYRIYKLIAGSILSAGIILILWIPFWGKESIISLYNYYAVYYKSKGIHFWADSIPYAVHFVLNKIGLHISKYTIANISCLIFFAIYSYLLYFFTIRVKTDKQAIFTTASFIMLALFFTNISSFQSWYLLWVIPFIFLSRIKSKFLLIFLLSYFLIMTFWKRMSVLAIPMMFVYFVMLRIYDKYKKRLGFLYTLK